MSRPFHPARALCVGALAATAFMFLAAGRSPSFAQVDDAKRILDALKGPPVTRKILSPAEQAKVDEERKVVDSVRNMRTRAIKVEAREKLAEIAATKRGVDLEINFEYNSAKLTPAALSQLDALGQALSDPELRGKAFLIEGHTDAAGSDEYNLALSDRRAEAVKGLLVEKFKLAPVDLVAVGYGEKRLKNPDGLAPDNRRVRVINLAAPQ